MSNPLISLTQGNTATNLGTHSNQNQQTGKRSFENILKGDNGVNTNEIQQNEAVSGSKLEHLRHDLIERLKNLPPGSSPNQLLLPELIDTRTRLGLLREAVQSSQGTQSTNVTGRFSQIENEWYQLENVMKSDKELSSGELLGLQARLYQVSQHIEVLSKVVDQVTSGIKTVLNTNI
jgi:hypothetical protein